MTLFVAVQQASAAPGSEAFPERVHDMGQALDQARIQIREEGQDGVQPLAAHLRVQDHARPQAGHTDDRFASSCHHDLRAAEAVHLAVLHVRDDVEQE